MEQHFDAFCAKLNSLKESTGAMADLRCALVPSREQRAWPYIADFCSLENERDRKIALTVAGAFAMQPKQAASKENMGDVMGRIALDMDKKNGLQAFSLRFQRILNCSTSIELIPFLRGIFSMAKVKDIPINHLELFKDLTYWGDNVKTRWASHYYAAKKDKGAENA